MKSLFLSIRNLFPYLLLISIYFFFVNIEARKDRKIYKNDNNFSNNEKYIINNKSIINDTNLKISIPVIPYNK